MNGREGQSTPFQKRRVRSGWWCSTLFFYGDLLWAGMKERSLLFMIGKPQGRPDICTISGEDGRETQ